MTLRSTIAAERERQGMTIQALADAAGVHRVQVSRYLTGTRDAYGETIDRLMAALGIAAKTTKRKGSKA